MWSRALCFSVGSWANIGSCRGQSAPLCFRVWPHFISNRKPDGLAFCDFHQVQCLKKTRTFLARSQSRYFSNIGSSSKLKASMVQKATTDADTTCTDMDAMLKKGSLIMAKLEEVYPQAPEGFLDHSDAFTLLIAVVLSAQSLDIKVNEITPALFRVGGTPEKMRGLGEQKIREIIKQIGLAPQKAKNIAKLSADICDKFDGQVPDTFEDLESLAGVGHKTASVIMMQAFGKPAFPVDTHIHRLACRWGCGDSKSVVKTEDSLKKWFPNPQTWGELHTRIILFGREYCPARNHDMAECPICSFAATDEAWKNNRLFPKKFTAPTSHKTPYSIRDAPPLNALDEACVPPSSSKKINSKGKRKTVVRVTSKTVEKLEVRKSSRPKTPVSYASMETGAIEEPEASEDEGKTSPRRGKSKVKANRAVKKDASGSGQATIGKQSRRHSDRNKSTADVEPSTGNPKKKRRTSSRLQQKK